MKETLSRDLEWHRNETVKFVLVSDFHFDLPEELIAQHPPAVRGSSRMLVFSRALAESIARTGPIAPALTDAHFTDLPNHLAPGDLLILNDSRVLPARLFATRAGLATQHNSPRPSGTIEVLLIEQVDESATGAPSDPHLWRALIKPARKVPPGETLHFYDTPGAPGSTALPSTLGLHPVLTAEVVSQGDFGERTLRFSPVPDLYDRLNRIGHMPLPPYIHRDQATTPDDEEDKSRYQTVYSQATGSAAAPTAGLHFTPEVLAALTARGVEIATLTLHVGLGTFQPVRVDHLADIRLHAERYTLPASTADALNRALSEGRRIVAVGTTTTRTLEHIAQEVTRGFSLGPHTDPGEKGALAPGVIPHFTPHSGSTSIFLSPGHRFRVVSGLLTNFHLPSSTLLMLVSAFASPRHSADPDTGRQAILAAYAYAIAHGYRFYSYGDCMLLL